MEAVVGHTQLGEEFKRRVQLHAGAGFVILAFAPGEVEGAGAEGVVACAAEGVPVAHGKAEVLFHGLAGHYAVLVVILEREGVVGLRAFVGNFANAGEILFIA